MAKKQTVQEEQPIQEEEQQEQLVGLDHLDDDTPAAIVKTDLTEYGEIKSWEARIAFQELAQRFGHDIGR